MCTGRQHNVHTQANQSLTPRFIMWKRKWNNIGVGCHWQHICGTLPPSGPRGSPQWDPSYGRRLQHTQPLLTTTANENLHTPNMRQTQEVEHKDVTVHQNMHPTPSTLEVPLPPTHTTHSSTRHTFRAAPAKHSSAARRLDQLSGSSSSNVGSTIGL